MVTFWVAVDLLVSVAMCAPWSPPLSKLGLYCFPLVYIYMFVLPCI